MTTLLLSLATLLAIPCAVVLSIAAVRCLLLKRPWPTNKKLAADLGLSVALTVAITIGITLVLHWTGILESQFYRPSNRDYGEQAKAGVEPNDVFFESQDGTRLHGWLFPSEGPRSGTVIHLHGSDRNISYTVKNALWLRQHGFDVFVFDYRGFGKSSGNPDRRGIVEDAVAAIKYVSSQAGNQEPGHGICLWGQSMGGQVAIVAARQADEESICGIVAEATYSSHRLHCKDKTGALGPLWLIQWAAWLVTSGSFDAEDAIGELERIPILLVHGTADKAVRPYHSERLYERATKPKQIWRVEDAGHLKVFDSTANREKLVEFLRSCCNSS